MTNAPTPWDKLAAGEGCSFDAPRAASNEDWDIVATLSVSSLYLPRKQTYRGHGILVFDPRHATRIDQLRADEWRAYSQDLHAAVTAVAAICHPDHVNVASLGNLMPHLHWHIVPRYKTDPRWGGPIWSFDAADDPDRRLEAADRKQLLEDLRRALPRA
jgi:diadenosine tetraphosphate (Ap4A) HIT family hydrolase